MEITISARGQNIPTQVTPQGNARFSVSFVPFEACEHVINIAFNKRTVPGCPIITRVGGDSHVTVSGQALSSAGLGRQSYLTVSNVAGSLEDLEVNVEGKFFHFDKLETKRPQQIALAAQLVNLITSHEQYSGAAQTAVHSKCFSLSSMYIAHIFLNDFHSNFFYGFQPFVFPAHRILLSKTNRFVDQLLRPLRLARS